jgi:tetratricopeptide (TPR) repeat protein
MLKHVVYQAARVITSGFFVACIFITGCTHLQTEDLLSDENNKPTRIELSDVPFIAQEQYQCGPASLAMMLQAAKKEVTAEELVSQVYLPEREGSLQIEILAAARQYNVIPYVLNKKMSDLLSEVRAQHPVLILQNLGLSWLPKWHYAVVVGYDFETAEIILRSGIEQRHVVAMKVFERTWARADYWAVVMLSPDTLPETADEQRYVESVVLLERMKKYETSKIAYQTALAHWPDNIIALMGLGNSYYAQQDYAKAAEIFRGITRSNSESADAYNNLADTLARLQRYEEAIDAAKRAVEIDGEHSAIYLQTLMEIERLSTMGDKTR